MAVWVARAVLATLAVGGTLLAGACTTSPGVAGAPQRVLAIDRAHGATPVMVAPGDRIALALVASEDERFFSHHGIDTLGLVRAAWGRVTGVDTGGSTLEMQLAHMLWPAQTQGVWGRVMRVGIALKLDGHYTKTAVLSMYLSAVYFGHGYYGVEAASRGFFGVAPQDVSWGQAAMLAGLVQAPSALDPLVHLQAARARQGYVLSRLVADGVLTPAQAQADAAAPVRLRSQVYTTYYVV